MHRTLRPGAKEIHRADDDGKKQHEEENQRGMHTDLGKDIRQRPFFLVGRFQGIGPGNRATLNNRNGGVIDLQGATHIDGNDFGSTGSQFTTWNNEIGLGLSYIHSLLLEDSTTVTNQTENNIRWSMTAEQVMSSNPVYQNLVSAGYRSVAMLNNGNASWTIINPTFSVRGSEPALTYNGLQFFLPNIPLTSAESALWPLTIDDLASTLQDEATVITVLANDFSPAGEPLSVDSFTQGENGGSVSDNGDGTLTYSPPPAYR